MWKSFGMCSEYTGEALEVSYYIGTRSRMDLMDLMEFVMELRLDLFKSPMLIGADERT